MLIEYFFIFTNVNQAASTYTYLIFLNNFSTYMTKLKLEFTEVGRDFQNLPGQAN